MSVTPNTGLRCLDISVKFQSSFLRLRQKVGLGTRKIKIEKFEKDSDKFFFARWFLGALLFEVSPSSTSFVSSPFPADCRSNFRIPLSNGLRVSNVFATAVQRLST